MTTRVRIVSAVLCVLCLAGCATQRTITPSAVVTSPQSRAIPADRAKHAFVIGKSTRADVIASLGETLVIRFDNGFEVWVYRLDQDMPGRRAPSEHLRRSASEKAGPGTSAEFVILFAPSGLVAKTRIRPAPQPTPAA
jgi:hypothetical protein